MAEDLITIDCPTCKGTGQESMERNLICGGDGRCQACGGTGSITFPKDRGR